MEHAKLVKQTVNYFMVEKEETMHNIEEICSVPGVDMVQFGPSDYCMSHGWIEWLLKGSIGDRKKVGDAS